MTPSNTFRHSEVQPDPINQADERANMTPLSTESVKASAQSALITQAGSVCFGLSEEK